MTARRIAAGLLAVAAIGAGVAGCGGDDDTSSPAPATTAAPAPATTAPSTTAPAPEPTPPAGGDATAGKAVFTTNCAGCHTLADAGASGTVGPNLDQLKPDAARVQNQVVNGGGAMPAFGGTLSEQEIADVAAYVSSAAGG